MIRRCVPATPITDHAPGDVFCRVAGGVQQYRGGQLIATHPATEASLNDPEFYGSGPITNLYFEERTMAASVTVIDILHLENGNKQIFYSNGTDEELSPLQLGARAAESTDVTALKQDIAAYWQARSSNFSSSTAIVGKTFQKDMSLELGQFQVGEV